MRVRGPERHQAQFDQKEFKDPSFLLNRLIDACKTLPEDQRNVIIDRFADTGSIARERSRRTARPVAHRIRGGAA